MLSYKECQGNTDRIERVKPCELTDAGGDAGASFRARDDRKLWQRVDGSTGHALGQGAGVLPTLVQQQVEDGAVVVVAVGFH